MLIISNTQELRELLKEEGQHTLEKAIKSAFYTSWEHYMRNGFTIQRANKEAATDIYIDLISDAFTEEVNFSISKKETEEDLLENMSITAAYVQQ